MKYLRTAHAFFIPFDLSYESCPRSRRRMELAMSKGRILIVDNEPQIRRVMRTTLIANGFEVEDVRSGPEALDLLHAATYDLVLLDINMPGMTGFEACRSIRAVSNTPIIMLTVRDAERDKGGALEAGGA